MSDAPPRPDFVTPRRAASAELREKGSRFVARLEPVATEGQAQRILERLRGEHRDATHVCWALRLGAPPPIVERCADDGEPAGTAGKPILRALQGRRASDVLLAVVRWFGGTKLGKGGLARAYAGAVRLALDELPVEARVPTDRLVLELPYDRLGAVERLVRPPAVEIVGATYGERVRLELAVHAHRRPALEAALADLRLRPEPRS